MLAAIRSPLLGLSRTLLPALALSLAFAAPAFAKKKDPPAPPPPPVAAPAPVEAPAPPPPPEEPPAPVVVNNASFNVTLVYADGTSKAGHVKGVERTADYSGDDGWTTEASKLKLSVEANATEKSVTWNDVKSIAITPGKMPDDIDCTYSSETTPWMYDCTLRTTSTATLKDGSKGTISNRHHWRFTFDDGSTLEFQVFKYQIREQDSRTVEFGDESSENLALYTKLQDQVRQDIKSKIVKSITVN